MPRYFGLLLIALAILTAQLEVSAYADSSVRMATRASVQGDFISLDSAIARKRSSHNRRAREDLSPLHFRAHVPGQGRVDITLTKIQAKYWQAETAAHTVDTTDVVFVNGTMRASREGKWFVRPLAGTFSDDGVRRTLNLQFQANRSLARATTTFYRIVLTDASRTKGAVWKDAENARVMRVPSVVLSQHSCGVAGEALHSFMPAQSKALARAPLSSAPADAMVAELSTEADAEFFARYGDTTNAEIAAQINGAETIFSRDLGVTFSIVKQIIKSSGVTTSTKSEDVLLDFRNRTNSAHDMGDADLYHFFTTRSLDDGVIGLAYVGAVCSDPLYSYGITEDYSPALNHLILAHELGHNFGALHDETTVPHSLMFPYADPAQDFFSALSKSQIQEHFDDGGESCLFQSGSSPTPEPTATPPVTDTPTPGGGNGGGGGTSMPRLSLSATVNRRGVFSAHAVLTGTTDSSCTTGLYIADSVSFRPKRRVFSSSTLGSDLRLSATIAHRISQGRKTPLYFRLEYNCPNGGGLTYSNKLKVTLARISTGRAITRKSWISSLVKAFR